MLFIPKKNINHLKTKTEIIINYDENSNIENPNINDVNGIFYSYIIEQNKKYEYNLIKCQFKLNVNDHQYCPRVTSNLSDNRKKISWSNFLEKVISDFKDEGYNFKHIAEKIIITIANKLDISYDSYIRYNMHAVEGKLNAD